MSLPREEKEHGVKVLKELSKRGVGAIHYRSLLNHPRGLNELAACIENIVLYNQPKPGIVFHDVPITSLGLPIPVANALNYQGITSLGVLALQTESYICSFRGIGTKAMEEINRVLKDHDMSYLEGGVETMADKAARYIMDTQFVPTYLAAARTHR